MYMYEGELGLCSGLNTQLSPMWQRFDSQTGRITRGLSLLVLYSALRGVSLVSPSPQNHHFI